MSSLYQPPLIPGLGSSTGPVGAGSQAQTKNPFFTIGNQFLPRNLHDLIRWVRYITLHSPVTTEVMRKLATYPITKFTYDAKDPAVRSKYEQIVKSFRLKTALHDVGFQYFTLGNVFLSVYYPFIRTYTCRNCKSMFPSENAGFLKFKNYEMVGVCPYQACGYTGAFDRKDVKSVNISDMNLITWDPVNISVNHNPISGKSKYYYKVPNDIKKKIQTGDRLTWDSTPWEFIEAVKDNKDFEFADDHIFHMKNIDMGMSLDGVSIPPLISHFNLVFYQATLRRANESIATDFMAPMRVIFPQPQTANSDPVVSISMRNFTSKMQEALIKHKHDNNHVLIAPVPIGYQAISGEGKALLVNQEIAQAEESLLLSMGVSRELLSGTSNWTSSTVGLRMLKNTLDSYVSQVLEVLEWMTTKVGSYLGIPIIHIGLTPFQLTDDDALKSVLMGLSANGNVSMTTIYESLGRDYGEELERMNAEAKLRARHDVRTQFEVEQSQYLEGLEISKTSEKDDSYMDALKQAQGIAAQLQAADPMTVQQVMNELQVTDYAKFILVTKMLQEGMSMMPQEQISVGGTDDSSGGDVGPTSKPSSGKSEPKEPGSSTEQNTPVKSKNEPKSKGSGMQAPGSNMNPVSNKQ